MTFAQKLKFFRKRQSLTASQAATKIHPELSVRTLESWEDGSRVPPSWVQALIFERLKK
jgi:DNA-binding transcriptional regulator YiaG